MQDQIVEMTLKDLRPSKIKWLLTDKFMNSYWPYLPFLLNFVHSMWIYNGYCIAASIWLCFPHIYNIYNIYNIQYICNIVYIIYIIYINITYIYIYIYIFYIYIHRHVFRPSQNSSVWLGLTSRERLIWCHQGAQQSTRCWALPKCLQCGERTKNILLSSVSSRVPNEWIQSVYTHIHVFCPSQDSSLWLRLTSCL